MCGIAGVIRYGKEPITEEMLALLLNGNEHRGNDASGIVLSQANGDLCVFKKAIPAWQFVTDKTYVQFIEDNLKSDTWGALLHTRYATQGNPKNNNNNHPMFAGKTAVIHNGTINNDDSLFKALDLKRLAETDSDILRAILDEFSFTQKGVTNLQKVNGSCAGAAFDVRHPQKLLIFRSGSPMTLGSTNDFFAFSSERGTVYKALKPYVKRFNVWFQVERPDAAMSPMADHTAWLMGPKGQEGHFEFKTMFGTYIEPVRLTYEKYDDRQARWARESKSKVVNINNEVKSKIEIEDAGCPKCQKVWTIPKGGKPGDYSCNTAEGGCGTRLISMDRMKAEKTEKGKGVN